MARGRKGTADDAPHEAVEKTLNENVHDGEIIRKSRRYFLRSWTMSIGATKEKLDENPRLDAEEVFMQTWIEDVVGRLHQAAISEPLPGVSAYFSMQACANIFYSLYERDCVPQDFVGRGISLRTVQSLTQNAYADIQDPSAIGIRGASSRPTSSARSSRDGSKPRGNPQNRKAARRPEELPRTAPRFPSETIAAIIEDRVKDGRIRAKLLHCLGQFWENTFNQALGRKPPDSNAFLEIWATAIVDRLTLAQLTDEVPKICDNFPASAAVSFFERIGCNSRIMPAPFNDLRPCSTRLSAKIDELYSKYGLRQAAASSSSWWQTPKSEWAAMGWQDYGSWNKDSSWGNDQWTSNRKIRSRSRTRSRSRSPNRRVQKSAPDIRHSASRGANERDRRRRSRERGSRKSRSPSRRRDKLRSSSMTRDRRQRKSEGFGYRERERRDRSSDKRRPSPDDRCEKRPRRRLQARSPPAAKQAEAAEKEASAKDADSASAEKDESESSPSEVAEDEEKEAEEEEEAEEETEEGVEPEATVEKEVKKEVVKKEEKVEAKAEPDTEQTIDAYLPPEEATNEIAMEDDYGASLVSPSKDDENASAKELIQHLAGAFAQDFVEGDNDHGEMQEMTQAVKQEVKEEMKQEVKQEVKQEAEEMDAASGSTRWLSRNVPAGAPL
eukprot:TRINITY_DN31520_c0_g1_i1.p1 TRINITY_DN31520_c0_g1~~TRINITY_DN31520_c0_g1_i1.p1  ORF type:complete len:668 (+),score=124.91 TRINITY_DN31520_c0_g1_i1:161-2164(+)